MKTLSLAVILAPVLLAACGGGGGSARPEPTRLETFGSLQSAANRLGTTAANDMPRTGTASYEGVALFGGSVDPAALQAAHSLSANVALSADFAAGSLEGSFTGFEGAGAVAGDRLDLSNGQIIGGALTADVGGKLKGQNTAGDLVGQFHGAGAEGVSGQLSGLTVGSETIQGAFVAGK